jgi:O-antigen biosynthesis protein WbqV
MVLVGLYDLAAAAFAMWASVSWRYVLEQKPAPEGIILESTLVFAASSLVVFALSGLHRGVWRFTALNDATRIVRAVVLANLVFFPVLFLINRLDGFPRTSVAIEAAILLALMLGPRLAVVAWRTGGVRGLTQLEDRSKPAAILVGEAAELDEALRGLGRGGAPFRVKGLIERAGGHAGRAIRGAPVLGGMEALDGALKRLSSAEKGHQPRIVLVDRTPDTALVDAAIKTAGRHGALLSRARPGTGKDAFAPIEATDMLKRLPRAPDLEPAQPLIAGKRVLVTGAGGTIGGQLSRLAAALEPEKLMLLDASEVNLYEIDMEFSERFADLPRRAVLADVRDQDRLDRIFAEEKPEIVLHAAALKHVPLMEDNPAEAVRTNLTGTRLTIEAARRHGVKTLALISTDKAVEPSSVMGATKRAAELQARRAAREDDEMRICVVRFGNVLGSNGSVAPLFERQIEAGEPVTVTDPEATRYFMTVEEASGLVLAAAAQTAADPARNGALYVLDMGEPVSILHLARQLLRLRGKDPDAPGAISIIGLRPGEKRHESLTYAYESMTPSEVEGVLRVDGPVPPDALVAPALAAAEAAAGEGDPKAARDAIYAACTLEPADAPA